MSFMRPFVLGNGFKGVECGPSEMREAGGYDHFAPLQERGKHKEETSHTPGDPRGVGGLNCY